MAVRVGERSDLQRVALAWLVIGWRPELLVINKSQIHIYNHSLLRHLLRCLLSTLHLSVLPHG